jgi:hypothetical protein
MPLLIIDLPEADSRPAAYYPGKNGQRKINCNSNEGKVKTPYYVCCYFFSSSELSGSGLAITLASDNFMKTVTRAVE